ncbi:MAG: threonylcarbamoyl-AMP synthase [FCB group bacterium]|nr:threonylcarbamoyl-AMP synthase [FCB group bacterium]
MLIEIHSDTPGVRRTQRAVEALKNGELIVYPTDTLYGVGCDIHCKSAIEKIYALKFMDKKKPLSILCKDFTQIAEYAHISNYAFKIMKKLLPGPFTVILPASNKVPKMLVTKQRTIGIRIPDNTFALQLVEGLGAPIITTTLETDEEMIISDPEEIHDRFSNQISLVFSEGVSYSDPSTVIDLTGPELVVLREGKGHIGGAE